MISIKRWAWLNESFEFILILHVWSYISYREQKKIVLIFAIQSWSHFNEFHKIIDINLNKFPLLISYWLLEYNNFRTTGDHVPFLIINLFSSCILQSIIIIFYSLNENWFVNAVFFDKIFKTVFKWVLQ